MAVTQSLAAAWLLACSRGLIVHQELVQLWSDEVCGVTRDEKYWLVLVVYSVLP